MINTADYFAALGPLAVARQERFRRTQSLEVADHAKFGGPDKTHFGSLGSLIVFIARDAARLQQVKAALKGGAAAMQRVVAEIDAQVSALKPGPVDAVIRQVATGPAFGSLTYGGATMADPIFLPPGLDLAVFMAPYNGGRLARQGFTYVEYVEKPQTTGLSLLVLKTDPQLSRAEQAALAAVPSDMTNLNVGVAYMCEYTTVLAAGGAVVGGLVGGLAGVFGGAVVGAVVGGAAGAIVDAALVYAFAHAIGAKTGGPKPFINAAELRRLGPEMSAKQLLNARLEAMQKARLEAVK
jgi:hypothetical protein